MQESTNWRQMLAEIIRDDEEERRISVELEVHRNTLWRWAKSENSPTRTKLRKLLNAVPEQVRPRFKDLIEREYADFFTTDTDGVPKEIPSSFYALAHRTLHDTSNRFWSVCSLVLQQALIQLDPHRVGMELIVVCCMPPRPDGMIRSLREKVGMGTIRPFRNDLQHKNLFLGAESLAGYAVTNAHQGIVQDIEKDTSLLPIHHVRDEHSAAAFPLVRESAIAGCLLATSTQVDYFIAQRIKLLEQYADVIANLALHDPEFYAQSLIELRVMPPYEIQELAFNGFRERVNALLTRSGFEEQTLNSVQAEQRVRLEMEEEFLLWHAGHSKDGSLASSGH